MIDSVLFIGGKAVDENTPLQALMQSGIMVAAADSGYDAAFKLGFPPQLICGDMDSLSDRRGLEAGAHTEVVQVDRDKDETDTELGLRLLRKRGYTSTLLCGGGASGRFDHELGVLWTFFRQAPPRAWLQPESEMVHLRAGEQLSCRLQPETVLSCFPASPTDHCSLESKGLKWPLQGLAWTRETIGISNEVISPDVTFIAHSGGLLIIRPHRVDGALNGDSILEALWRV